MKEDFTLAACAPKNFPAHFRIAATDRIILGSTEGGRGSPFPYAGPLMAGLGPFILA